MHIKLYLHEPFTSEVFVINLQQQINYLKLNVVIFYLNSLLNHQSLKLVKNISDLLNILQQYKCINTLHKLHNHVTNRTFIGHYSSKLKVMQKPFNQVLTKKDHSLVLFTFIIIGHCKKYLTADNIYACLLQ